MLQKVKFFLKYLWFQAKSTFLTDQIWLRKILATHKLVTKGIQL